MPRFRWRPAPTLLQKAIAARKQRERRRVAKQAATNKDKKS